VQYSLLWLGRKKGLATAAQWVFISTAIVALLDPRTAQMNAPPFNLCADERISPGFSTDSVNKSQGDPKKS
jgi:hypothetical protein